VVVPDQNACEALIRKLDNALLRQRLSPFDAFKKADKNGDKEISIDELRQAIKDLVPSHEMSPADLKMTMVAFDTNRNNRIDENEFIACITKARGNAPPAQAIQPSSLPQQAQVGPQTPRLLTPDDVKKFILRLVFANAMMPPADLKRLAAKNLYILQTYWSKQEDFTIEEDDFLDEYCALFSDELEASALHAILAKSFAKNVQLALDYLLERLRPQKTRVTKALMEVVANM